MKAKPGDRVLVTLDDAQREGTLMPRPAILKPGHIVLKLDSGYNIGIDELRIKKIDVIEEFKPNPQEHTKRQKKTGLATIAILSFGGTISSKVDYRTGGTYADYTAEDFVQMLPELEDVANLRARKVMGIMSEDMVPQDWQMMVQEIAKELNDEEVVGVVVSQGTDTLHYSSAAMSFMLKDLKKPVVFTAAQRSIDRGSSDAFMNLLCAIHAAKSDIAEVMTCMHGTENDDYCLLIRGTKVRKMHTSRRDAFRPINELPIAKMTPQGSLEIINANHRKRSAGKTEASYAFEQKIGLLHVHPGMSPEVLDHFIEKKYRGLVIAGTGLGHVPTYNASHSLIAKIEKLIAQGCVVVITAQALYGRVHPFVYSPLRHLSMKVGCVFGEDMLPEVAYAKLGWALGQEHDTKKVKEMMQKSIVGEITERSDVESFLY